MSKEFTSNGMNVLKFIKIFFINLLVFIVLYLLIEAYTIYSKTRTTTRITCNYSWVLYNYCPKITYIKEMASQDGGHKIESYTNSIGQRIPKKDAFANTNNPALVIIGDSFIQSAGVEWEDTFYSKLSMKYNVEAIGYASWNILQYYDAIKKLSYKNTTYAVFITGNDYNPNYSRSIYQELKNYRENIEDIKIPTRTLYNYYEVSITYKLINILKKIFNNKKEVDLAHKTKKVHYKDFSGFSINDVQNCEILRKKAREIVSLTVDEDNSMIYDYLMSSKDPKCWEEKFKIALEKATSKLNDIVKLTKSLNSRIIFYYIPSSIAIKNEGTEGRKYYSLNHNDVITTMPVFNYFSKNIENVETFNFEEILQKSKNECRDNCSNIFYFPYDGHLTKKGHVLLANYILATAKIY